MKASTGISPIPAGYHTLSPCVLLNEVEGCLAFCQRAFDAQVVRKVLGPDGNVFHAELRLGDSHIKFTAALGLLEPIPGSIYFYVADVDAVFAQALAAGAEEIDPPTAAFDGDRKCRVRDAWGNSWWIATHIEDVTETDLQRRALKGMR